MTKHCLQVDITVYSDPHCQQWLKMHSSTALISPLSLGRLELQLRTDRDMIDFLMRFSSHIICSQSIT